MTRFPTVSQKKTGARRLDCSDPIAPVFCDLMEEASSFALLGHFFTRSSSARSLQEAYASRMPPKATFHESRRSTRVPLKVILTVEGEDRRCDGETITVNLHGALIATAVGLSSGMPISILVYLTDKRAAARVVYVDPTNPMRCGIELDHPRNIWGVSVLPDDWTETSALEIDL